MRVHLAGARVQSVDPNDEGAFRAALVAAAADLDAALRGYDALLEPADGGPVASEDARAKATGARDLRDVLRGALDQLAPEPAAGG